MKRLCFLTLCLLLLLAGCSQPKTEGAAAQQEEPATLTAQALSLFPPSYDLSFRLEAFQGEERTSYSHITAIQTSDGFYYASSTGERYLFLRMDSDAYAFYLWDEATGTMVANQNLTFSRAVLEGFQDSILHLGLLVHDVSNLDETGTANIAGRPCQVYEGSDTAGDQFHCRRTYYIDQETGLTLSHSIQYTDQTGRAFTYLLTCEHFSTQQATLPNLSLVL